MPNLSHHLEIPICPHCGVNTPNLEERDNFETNSSNLSNKRFWRVYVCSRCGGVVTAFASTNTGFVKDYFPSVKEVDEFIPDDPRDFLQQAIASVHAPSGAIMLAASAVDAMLKLKGYEKGVLNDRIKKAAADKLITEEMSKWAHAVRLDANAQRHADNTISKPTETEAKRSIDFAMALAEFLFVLPARVEKGLSGETPEIEDATPIGSADGGAGKS